MRANVALRPTWTIGSDALTGRAGIEIRGASDNL
jgi:hypothetical protein